ncbi:1-acyl-sn-glycerol-3-phosphate acyltransferase [Roseovarius sp. EL26]|uniref:lysophospholipid acyltransferase family protein n=1 Tax=Roseovarius sp. EL26 TaxID=2126672 RepID=UPI000EA3F8AD|nr:lysophospholipid acyltransferase family protein [Roseovarius sp. EL26]
MRIVLRGGAFALILFVGAIISFCIRLIERPFTGEKRPFSPYLTQWVARSFFILLGMRHEVSGEYMKQSGAVVANHASWFDIFALNARKRIYFVSKSEVANWPVIGFLAGMVGTVFIARDPRQAKVHQKTFENRLLSGHKLLFFPEGTSTDGMRVLSFKPTLFQAFFADNLLHELYIQPVSVTYLAPKDQDPRFYAWFGDMEFGSHFLQLLAAPKHGSVSIVYHSPLKVDAFTDRKALAKAAEDAVRSGMPADRQIGAVN